MLHLKDISARAGVSVATVSRVLRGMPGVAEPTRAAVLAAIDVLGYERPGPREEGGADLVAVVAPAAESLDADPWAAFAAELTEALAAEGYLVLHCEPGQVERLLASGRGGRSVRGIVWCAPASRRRNPSAAAIAQVAVGVAGAGAAGTGGVASAGELMPGIAVDQAGAIDQGVRYLAQLGHRQIGLSVASDRESTDKIQAFRRSMAARLHIAGTRAQAPVVASAPTVGAGAQAARDLLQAGCTAVISGSSALTLGAVQAAARAGAAVPDRLSILGYGTLPARFVLRPRLTAVVPPWRAMARSAAAELVAQIRSGPGPAREPGRARPEPGDLVFSAELLLGDTTAPPAR